MHAARPDTLTVRFASPAHHLSFVESIIALIASQHGSGPFEICRRVDAERNLVDAGYRDRHARFQRTQLFELLAQLERRWRKIDEPRQRLALVGVNPDVMEERAFTGRRAGPRKIKRASAPAARVPRYDGLHDAGIVEIRWLVDLGRERGDFGAGGGKRGDDGANGLRVERWKIALQI